MDEHNNEGDTRTYRELHEIRLEFKEALNRIDRARDDAVRLFEEFRGAVEYGKTWREPVGAGS